MKPLQHAIASFSLSVILTFLTKSLYAGLICFFSGFLLDIDHLLEYVTHYGWRDFTVKKIHEACDQTLKGKGRRQFRRIYLIFHSIEIAFIAFLVSIYTKNIYIFAFFLGYIVHLILDCLGNSQYPKFYLITWRAVNKFHTDKLLRKKA